MIDDSGRAESSYTRMLRSNYKSENSKKRKIRNYYRNNLCEETPKYMINLY